MTTTLNCNNILNCIYIESIIGTGIAVKLCKQCSQVAGPYKGNSSCSLCRVLLLRERQTFTAVRLVGLAGDVTRRAPVEGRAVRALVAMAIG
jgi:hypothetical protein